MQGKHHTEESEGAARFLYGRTRVGIQRHGWARTPTYKSYNSMISRCRDEGNASFPDYGGRGIKVCNRWVESFEDFLEDMGERPGLEYQIDRRDPDGNYEPSNCRWITRAENNARRRDPGGWIKKRAKQLAQEG